MSTAVRAVKAVKTEVPKYKVEILTATKDGLAAFLLDLKKAQIQHQLPIEAWAKMKKGPKNRKLSYPEAINKLVGKWEAQERASIKARYDRQHERELKEKQAAETLGFGKLGGGTSLAEAQKEEAETRLHRIKDYIGTLNRDINAPRVEAYAAKMSAGEWWFTPDPIVVTDEGAIINGQHRLLAAEGVLNGEEGRYESFGGTRFFREFTPWPAAATPQFVVVWGTDRKAAILMDESRRSSTDRRDIAMRYAQSQGLAK